VLLVWERTASKSFVHLAAEKPHLPCAANRTI
jgi:hypothetical protein